MPGNVITHWVPSSFTFSPRDLHTSEIFKNQMYIIGGWSGDKLRGDVLFTRINLEQGNLISPWSLAGNLPSPRGAHATILFEGRLYVLGGLVPKGSNSVSVTDKVIYADINANGTLNAWQKAPSLLLPLAYHTAILVESQRTIYIIGGRSVKNDIPFTSEKVYSTTILSNGELNNWQPVPFLSLSPARHRHASVNSEGSIYLIGGEAKSGILNDVSYIPPLSLTKSADPPGPIHEGDLITYTIAYANTGLTTQTITLTDQIPFNVSLEPGTIIPPGYLQGSQIIWPIGSTAPGQSGQVSFAARVPLLPSLDQLSISAMSSSPPPGPPAYVLPVPVSCDTTRFWANGVTVQPPPSGAYTLHVQIPPGANPSEMWLMMKGINHPPPMVEEQPAQQVMTSTSNFSASLWSAPITPPLTADNQLLVVTQNPRELNAIFLFDQNDPPFDKTTLEDFYQTTKTFTYTFDIPSVTTRTMAVIMPVLDITYLTDSTPPQVDTRLTTVTMEFGDRHHTVMVNSPNLGNGLLMTQFPFDISRTPGAVNSIKTLTITVDTEDSVYTLGPRVCRPVYIENTAWLCSDKAGCLSATATNLPESFIPPHAVYLPLILKPNPN